MSMRINIFRRVIPGRSGPLAREESFTPTPEEMALVEQFGNDRTPFLEVMGSLRQSGIPDSDREKVWDLIRSLRRSNLGSQGKER